MAILTALNGEKPSNIVYEQETNYYYARVVDAEISNFGKSRILFLDFDSHSIDSEQLNTKYYPEMYPVFNYINKDIKDILVIGGGAYTMPKLLKDYYKNANVSVIETDPEVKKISEQYFKLSEYDIKTIINDAKIEINKNTAQYDLIFGDAYNSFISVPWYLLTKEWNEQVKNRLNEDGIYAINFIGTLTGIGEEFTKSVINTFRLTFPNFYIFSFGNIPEQAQNIVIIGINGNLPLTEKELYAELKKINNLLYKQIEPVNFFVDDNSLIITDNFSPIEKLFIPIIRDYFPKHIKYLEETITN